MRAVIAALAAMALVGCAATPDPVPGVIYRSCTEPEPERPTMPTEQLAPDVDPDTFTAAAIAEIERREGYEIRLRSALTNCRK